MQTRRSLLSSHSSFCRPRFRLILALELTAGAFDYGASGPHAGPRNPGSGPTFQLAAPGYISWYEELEVSTSAEDPVWARRREVLKHGCIAEFASSRRFAGCHRLAKFVGP